MSSWALYISKDRDSKTFPGSLCMSSTNLREKELEESGSSFFMPPYQIFTHMNNPPKHHPSLLFSRLNNAAVLAFPFNLSLSWTLWGFCSASSLACWGSSEWHTFFFFFVFIDIITKPIPMNHRIMEYPNLGGTHKDYQVQLLKGVGGNPYGLLGGHFMT